MQANNSQITIYQTESGETKIDVRFQDETVWLTQKLMAELFQTSVPNINMHLKSVFEEGELEENSTVKDFLIVQKEGSREVKRHQIFYNLDAISIRIEDDRMPFDPTQSAEPDIDLSVEDRPIGGLGIFLIKEIMDEVNYTREWDKNVFFMSKVFGG